MLGEHSLTWQLCNDERIGAHVDNLYCKVHSTYRTVCGSVRGYWQNDNKYVNFRIYLYGKSNMHAKIIDFSFSIELCTFS